ncbi:MAG: hypothetical protein REI64_14425 [Pedobacter sp.]|uniref:hypothetical protein n=1 Tax=Pedobacter sp. TaxID=1411316 RepID=UPI00280A38B9|nr:hypothetical protein [Pedobacter sp.]MDQ8005994.1 hypothetical protein [Pedobacter sp.]
MKRILIPILLSLIGCTNQQKPVEKSMVDTLVEIVKPTTQTNVDTSYVSLFLKIDGSNTIAIKRGYYNPKDYSIYRQTFFLNGEKIFTDTGNYLVDSSKYSRIIVEKGSVLLFMECDGHPNLDYLSAYSIDIKNKKMTYLSSSVFDGNPKSKTKPFTDIDGDGFIEYGGFDLTEMHPNPDSMYYRPSSFYEIRNGKLFFDSLLTKREDIKANAVYSKNPINLTVRKPKI